MVMRRSVARALGLFAVVVLAELILRFGIGLGDPPLVSLHEDTEYQLVPDRQYQRFGNLVAINEHGMRSADIPIAVGPTERRVLLIGDSVIYGNHFLDQSETIAHRLQTRLAGSPQLNGCDPLVMAAAVSSWGPVNQAAFLRKTGLLQADLGLLVVSGHDLYDTPHFGTVVPYRVTAPFVALDDARLMLVDRLAPRVAPTRSIDERRAATLAALDQIADEFSREDVDLTLLYHPTMTERVGDTMPARDVFMNWAETRGLDSFDLGSTDVTQGDYRDNIHPSALGADVLAGKFGELAATRLRGCR